MNVTQIEETVKKLASDVLNSSVDKDKFIYELMAAYGHRKTTVSRIKSGERNLAKVAGEVRAKRHIYFKHSDSNKVFSDIDDMKKEPSVTREKIRFIIATDFNQFVAIDTRTNDTLDIEFGELGKHFDFFLPWAGMEKAVYQGDNPADVKAAEKMAKLFDLIKADNFSEKNKNDTAALHSLNVFLTRLLFCFFAEDTGIFTDNQFSSELESHTKADGSDVDSYLNRLFKVLNTSKENRHDLPDYLAKFEYVNGGLFADAIASPKFSTKSRRMLIECGSELDWSDINPDIFGSMIQAVVHPDQRGGMGMHYTSVINIMKVIEPLFLDDLYAELENIAENIDPKLKPSRLRKLHDRIANIKIFDPACGSGNFLIIAFKELRKLEMEVIKLRQELVKDGQQDDFFDEISLDSSFSRIRLSQFYGIELDDFAHEVAILSLWLAEHQMNVEFEDEFGECAPTLPLRSSGSILQGNATELLWTDYVKGADANTFIIGNPPYLGAKRQNKKQKEDLKRVFHFSKDYKNLDYIACWFYLASLFIKETQAQAAFVSTNSVVQGDQVALLWPHVFSKNIEISFGHSSFKWENSAKNKAGVDCVIIGLREKSTNDCYLFNGNYKLSNPLIGPYLNTGSMVIVGKSTKTLNGLPEMIYGNMPLEGGFLKLSELEKDNIINTYPQAQKFIRPTIGGDEFLKSIKRWCIWIEDEDLKSALEIPPIAQRVQGVRDFRTNGGEVARTLVERSHQFRYRHTAKNQMLIVPCTSSENREYIQCGFFSSEYISMNSVQVILDPELWVFGVLSSKMHMIWVKAVAGRLESRIRYSNKICYNTFPCPDFTDENKEVLTELSIKILSARERHLNTTVGNLYKKGDMPSDLLSAHLALDTYFESLYKTNPLKNDDERLEILLKQYVQMTGSENA